MKHICEGEHNESGGTRGDEANGEFTSSVLMTACAFDHVKVTSKTLTHVTHLNCAVSVTQR